MTTSKIKRLFLSAGFTLSLGCCLALGCGSSQEAGYDYPSGSSRSDLPRVPGHVVAQLESCAHQGAGRLTLSSYAIMLDVTVNEDGSVRGVKINDSMLGDRGIESCMVGALQGMTLPTSIATMRSSRPVSEGVVAPGSRALLGAPLVIIGGAAVAFGPVVFVAVGVTFVVGVTLYFVSKATTSEPEEPMTEQERCRKVNEACQIECAPYLDSGDYSGMPYHKCMRQCQEAAGCWKGTNR